jgi:hypothetical protein
LVLPVASVNTDKVTQISPQRIEILKDNGTLVLESNVPLWIKPMNRERAFNLVPGVEAVPVYARFNPDVSREVVVKLSVI